jgi:hypothetical protein
MLGSRLGTSKGKPDNEKGSLRKGIYDHQSLGR